MTTRQQLGWCLAMFLSLGRIALGWVVIMRVWSAGIDQHPVTAWTTAIFFCAVAASDKLDGFIARHFDAVTNSGKFMDHFADKLVMLPLLYVCYLWTWQARVDAPTWALVFLMWPHVILVAFRWIEDPFSVWLHKKLPSRGADQNGKLKTAFDMLGCFLALCGMVAYSYHPFTRGIFVATPLVFCAAAAVCFSYNSLKPRWTELTGHKSFFFHDPEPEPEDYSAWEKAYVD